MIFKKLLTSSFRVQKKRQKWYHFLTQVSHYNHGFWPLEKRFFVESQTILRKKIKVLWILMKKSPFQKVKNDFVSENCLVKKSLTKKWWVKWFESVTKWEGKYFYCWTVFWGWKERRNFSFGDMEWDYCFGSFKDKGLNMQNFLVVKMWNGNECSFPMNL